jgi:hypothetical protein
VHVVTRKLLEMGRYIWKSLRQKCGLIPLKGVAPSLLALMLSSFLFPSCALPLVHQMRFPISLSTLSTFRKCSFPYSLGTLPTFIERFLFLSPLPSSTSRNTQLLVSLHTPIGVSGMIPASQRPESSKYHQADLIPWVWFWIKFTNAGLLAGETHEVREYESGSRTS